MCTCERPYVKRIPAISLDQPICIQSCRLRPKRIGLDAVLDFVEQNLSRLKEMLNLLKRSIGPVLIATIQDFQIKLFIEPDTNVTQTGTVQIHQPLPESVAWPVLFF